eukprot:SAG11_NODE_27968_length_326_cov_4.167401_1_plen_48_part_01
MDCVQDGKEHKNTLQKIHYRKYYTHTSVPRYHSSTKFSTDVINGDFWR